MKLNLNNLLKRQKIMKMKNKILFLLAILFLPIMVFADTNCSINLSKGQNNNVNIGDIVTLNIGFDEIANNSAISSMEYRISYDKNTFEIVKDNNHYININSDLVIDYDNLDTNGNNAILNFKVSPKADDYSITNNTSNKNSLIILKLKVKSSINSQTNIILDNNSKYIENSATKNCSRSAVTVYIKSSNNSLSSIKIDNKELSNFNENNTIYYLNVDGNTENINISAEKKDVKSSISGDIGNKSLKYGVNTFKIIVTSESGDKKTYEINITRVDERSHINTLKSLKLSSGTINFDSSVNDYNITVKNEIEKITITSELTDTKSKYKEDYRNKTIELNEGMNKVSITIIAEDNRENTYNLNITRELSSNNTLSKLLINNKEITLLKDTFLYNYEVENDITKVDIDVTPSNPKASIEVEDTNLEVGENEINIYVTAPNGDVVSYTLIITRKEKLSSNSLIKMITVNGYSLDFKSNTMYYTLKIKDEEVLDIKVTPEDEKTTIDIEGNKDLIDGSIIKITAKSEDNTITRYFITIEKGNKSSLTWLIILLILLIIIALIIIFLLRKKEKKLVNNEEEVKEEIKPVYHIDEKEDDQDEDEPDDKEDEEKKDENHDLPPLKRSVLIDNNEEE